MAAVNLPDSPANGTTQTVNGITYTYNSSKGYWTTASSGTATTQVITSDSAPSNPADGDLWYDTDYGGMFVYYADGTSNQWVEVIGTQGAQGTLQTSDSAPSNPSDGDLWYDTDDGGLFIYYSDGTSNQWVEVVGQTGPAGPQGPTGAAGSTTVVADTTALLAISSPSAGDMAYVSGNNTLYFYNGSGWYKIALINTTPSISGANASYALATDGTATTVTLVASDPEGLPITYSIASDTSGNIATVTQGTGSSTNVFTITPSTNSAHAGTFSLTFRASDGVNFGTAASSFTLQFSIQNSRYTTALVTSTGANGAQNANTFDDASTSNHTLTRTLALQTSFSPYRPGGYSQEFNGSNTSINIASNTDFAFGTGDFTVEWWCKLPDQSSTMFIDWRQGGSGLGNLHIGTGGYGGSLAGAVRFTGDGPTIVSTSVVDDNEWHHVAICRASGTTKMYIDGTEEGSASDTTDYARGGLRIGNNSYASGGSHLNGLMADLRIVKGTAVYTSNFTVPDETLTAITNTKLLLFTKPYQRDMSSSNHTLVCYGNLKAVPSRPFDSTLEYDTAVHGGSIDCRPNGAFVNVADSDDFTFGSGDWTIEFWTYRTAGTGTDYQTVIAGVGSWALEFMSNNRLSFWASTGSSGNWDIWNQATLGHADGTSSENWHHYAVQKSGNNLVTYQNGVQSDSRNFNTHVANASIGNPTAINVGYYNSNQNDMTGFISDLQVTKGTAKYSGNFIPPTQRVSLHSNTKLSIPATEAGIIDKAQAIKYIDCYNGVASSTTQTKYYTSSIGFDGTNDYLELGGGLGQFRTKDFTIELWAYASAIGSYAYLIEARNSGSQNNAWTLSFNYMGNVNNDILQFATFNGSTATAFLTSNTAFPTGTWKHIAVTRSGTTMKMFFDGTEVASNSSAGFDFALDQDPIYIGTRFNIANYFNGYMSDIRITKGFARYTSNFTAPTAALKG